MNLRNFMLALGLTGAVCCLNAQSTYSSSLPVKPGKGVTVAGVVECDGKPVQGVVVSDGYEVTTTDRKGAYYLKSKKQNPQVFITCPSGYDVYRDDVVPQFWADFTEDSLTLERHDFRLQKADNERHATIIITDVHLANQRNDVNVFCGPYTERIRQQVKELNEQGVPVYTFNLGDASWDQYWYGHNYPIGNFRQTLNDCDYPTAVYSCMGNHDNDGSTPADADVDYNASLPYQKSFGPRYYSQNIGNVHYVFLDNVTYKNEPLPAPSYTNINGKRNYKESFTPEQLEWLRKDLANVPFDTPIILAMHCPMFRWNALDPNPKRHKVSDDITIRTDSTSTLELMDILKPYQEVHSLSGHSHKQCLVRLPQSVQNLTEHNISGTCGNWWHTRATGLKNLCPDGTPTAFELFNIDGKQISWEHKTFEYGPDQQFFAWDMNSVKEYMKNNAEMQAFVKMYPKWSDFSSVPDNYVYVNLWAWDPDGKLTITEGGRELPVEMVVEQNPIYDLSYMVRNTVWTNNWKNAGYDKPRKFQLFRVKASAADTPVEITWRDYFGHETKQVLNRPAPFQMEIL